MGEPIDWKSMDDDQFVDRAETQIWLSAFASNNPRAPAHKESDAAYDEARRREKPWLYQRAWNKAYRSCGYEPSEREIELASPPSPQEVQMTETISGVAMRVGRLVVSMKPPARHHTILNEMDKNGISPFIAPKDQGFITSSGRFVDRSEGCVIARVAGQIIKKTGPAEELFSEDLW